MIHAHNGGGGGGREEVGVVVGSVGWVGGTRSAHRAQGVRHSMGIQNALPPARLPRFVSLSLFLSNSPPRVCCFHIAEKRERCAVLLFVLPACSVPLILKTVRRKVLIRGRTQIVELGSTRSHKTMQSFPSPPIVVFGTMGAILLAPPMRHKPITQLLRVNSVFWADLTELELWIVFFCQFTPYECL